MKKPRRFKRWEIAQAAPFSLTRQLSNLPPLIVQLLYNRGIVEPQNIKAFLAIDTPSSFDPFLLKDIDRALDRILAAIDNKESIAVYGDFDVDGITSAALVTETLTALGANVIPYIPSRENEGYGLNSQAIHTLHQQGVGLIITTDCGTGDDREIDVANSIGIDVIVTDHHQITKGVPQAYAVVNPRQDGCSYPFKDLAGVGVAFKVVQALLQRKQPVNGLTSTQLTTKLFDLVALGTIADLAPLIGENRTLVQHGLAVLNNTDRPGLQEMIRGANLRQGAIVPTTVSFVLGPRLNSAGRLAHASISYQLLTTNSREKAQQLATLLERTNEDRQRITAEALAKARQEVARIGEEANLFLIAGQDYPSGVVGLVAGRLAEEYYRPVLVVELGENHSRGSARSIAEFDITEALGSCEQLLSRFGGHAQAAGFTIPNANLNEFGQRLTDFATSELAGLDLQPKLVIDAEVPWNQVTWDLHQQISRLAPFGFGNPNPTFVSRRARVLDSRVVGRDLPKHLRLRLTDGKRQWTAIAFNRGEDAPLITPYIDVAYTLEPNEWNGSVSLDLHVKDWRPVESH